MEVDRSVASDGLAAVEGRADDVDRWSVTGPFWVGHVLPEGPKRLLNGATEAHLEAA